MKNITHIRCIVPFTLMMIHHHGYCYSCCPAWTKIGNIGRLTERNSIMEIWNNERMQYLRKAILDNQLEKVCNFKYCPYAIKNEYLNLEAMKNDDRNLNLIIDQIIKGRTILDTPPHTFEISNSGKCNLRCVMCQTNDKRLQDDARLDERLYTHVIPEILPNISKLFMTGNGEVFFNRYSRKFLQSLDVTQYPSFRIQLLTNGILLTPKLWESIKHNRFESVSVSVDAASQETYAKIRKNGNWELLRRNLDFLSELRSQNVFYYFCINFTVMKSNYREMKEFTELGIKLGCDKIVFQRVFGLADIRENINFTNNTKVFVEIAGILTDSIFSRPEVDTAQIDEYRKYADRNISVTDRLFTKGMEWLLYLPIKTIFAMAKYFSFIHTMYEFLNQKRIPVTKSGWMAKRT